MELVPGGSIAPERPAPGWFMNPENPPGNSGRGWTDQNWLVSRCHVGDAAGVAAGAGRRGDGSGRRGTAAGGFGPLRQLDLQLVQPMRGFGTHCDLDMEVLTYVVEGRLAHRDATGREATLLPGGIQCVTGGTGAYHSEFNPAHATPLRQVRLHVLPRGKCLEPRYGACQAFRRGSPAHKNRWLHLAGDALLAERGGSPPPGPERAAAAAGGGLVLGGPPSPEGEPFAGGPPAAIQQDCNVLVCDLDAGGRVALEVRAGRQVCMVCLDGAGVLHGPPSSGAAAGLKGQLAEAGLEENDGARLYGPLSLQLEAGPCGLHVLCCEVSQG